MAELKTKPTDASVETFLNTITDAQKRRDAFTLLKMMQRVTRMKPRMWGANIVGFGSYHYKYASGRAGDWFLVGFAPRQQNLTLYIMPGFERYAGLMQKLGKHTTGKSCLYIKQLDDVDLAVLAELIAQSIQQMARPKK
ncbi:MAG: DUF1801 domain-containing protein [Chloroflexi bacterium]|nr:DUF1801 domain-containing protein [Chloroflexota bacterium]